MRRIHPITEQSCRTHYGKPVLLYLTDGTEIQGMLSRVEGGRLYLNEQPRADGAEKTVKLKKKTKIKAKIGTVKKASAAKNSAVSTFEPPFYGPYSSPYETFGAPLAFDVTAIAALFLLI